MYKFRIFKYSDYCQYTVLYDRYYQIQPKVVWKVHGAWIDGYDSLNKDKNITITKKESIHSNNHVIPHPVIAAILNVILNILQHWKTTITCQSNSPNTTENYQK